MKFLPITFWHDSAILCEIICTISDGMKPASICILLSHQLWEKTFLALVPCGQTAPWQRPCTRHSSWAAPGTRADPLKPDPGTRQTSFQSLTANETKQIICHKFHRICGQCYKTFEIEKRFFCCLNMHKNYIKMLLKWPIIAVSVKGEIKMFKVSSKKFFIIEHCGKSKLYTYKMYLSLWHYLPRAKNSSSAPKSMKYLGTVQDLPNKVEPCLCYKQRDQKKIAKCL